MSNKRDISRRRFLKRVTAAGAGAVAAPWAVPASALGLADTVAPSNRIAMGFIGVGTHGVGRNLNGFLAQPDAHVVAVCDVDSARAQGAKQLVDKHYAGAMSKGTYQGCAAHGDFRQLIARDDVDAVMNSTPDHWHVIPSVMAAKAGKDVICEKPLTLTVAEGRVLSDTMKRYDRIFQTSTENRSIPSLHRICELVRNGRIGRLRTIHVELPEGRWIRHDAGPTLPPEGADKDKWIKEEFHKPCPVPKGFDYDMWLGQAPEAPYTPSRCHWNFRYVLDYSGGMLTDWGAHIIDIAQWGNNTEQTGPIEVEGKGEFPQEGIFNTATQFRCEYKYANGVKLTISSSVPAVRFEGTEGWIAATKWAGAPEAEPKSVLESKIGPDETHLFTCPGGEHRNFLDCVKSREPCYAPAEVGHRTATIAHLGNIAMMLGRKLRWDPEAERFVDDPEADRMLSRPMRPPWKLEAV